MLRIGVKKNKKKILKENVLKTKLYITKLKKKDVDSKQIILIKEDNW